MAVKGNKLTPRCREAEVAEKVRLGAICSASTSQIRQKDLDDNLGQYPIYGASGVIKFVDFYQIESEGLGIVKDGAGVGRVMRLPSFSSVIGTVMIIRPQAGVDCGYLFYALAKQNLGALCTGATIPHLYFKDFKDRKIKLLSLPTQRRIAAELDKICELKKNAETRLEKLDLLVKSRFVEMFGTLAEHRFEECTLESICEFIKDGTHQTPTYTTDTVNGYKFLSSKDVVGGVIDWSRIKYIPRELHEELYARLSPRKNDILLAKNGTTGVAALVETDEVFDIYVSLALLRFKADVEMKYILWAINSPETKRQFNHSLKGVGVPNLHLGEIKKTIIPIPPLALQREFAAFVAKVDKLKLAARKSIEQMDLLYRSKLQEYFG